MYMDTMGKQNISSNRNLNKKMRLAGGMLILVLAGLLFVGGCGRKGGDKTGGAGDDGTVGSAAQGTADEVALVQPVEWPTQWKGSPLEVEEGRNQTQAGTVQEGTAQAQSETEWSVCAFQDKLCNTPAGFSVESRYTACWESSYYCLRELVNFNQEREFDLTIYDTGAESASSYKIDFSGIQFDGVESDDNQTAAEFFTQMLQTGTAMLDGMDVGPCGIYLFFRCFGEEWETLHYYAIRLDGALRLDKATDLGTDDFSEPRMDGSGRFYVMTDANSAIVALDENGHYLEKITFSQPQEYAFYLCKLPDGRPLYYSPAEQTTFFTVDGTEKKVLYAGQTGDAKVCGTGVDGKLFYRSSQGIFSWDVVNGKTERIVSSGDSYSFNNCDAIVQQRDGKLCLIFNDGESIYSNVYAKGQRAESVEIEVMSFVFNNGYLKKCAEGYCRTHPGVQIRIAEIEDGRTERDNKWSTTMAELAAGRGPDVMIVDRERLAVLQEKGVLADLSNLLDAECRKQIIPGALQYGEIDGRLYGITSGVTASNFMVSDEVWERESWTLEDILNILENQEMRGEPYETVFRVYHDYTAMDLLHELTLANLEESDFLDLEKGKCYFDSEQFCHVMEVCKKYGKNSSGGKYLSVEEQAREMKQGSALAIFVEGGLKGFSEVLASLGEGWHTIGFPSNDGSGYLLNSYSGCAVVNSTVEYGTKRETIDRFLASLVDYDMQKKYSMSWVRMDVLRDCVMDAVEMSDWTSGNSKVIPVFTIDGKSIIPLEGKPDGTSYLPEYLAVLCAAKPAGAELNAVINIFYEEAPSYFEGTKSVKEVAGILQSRVQLYLDERK